ncbi:MAG: hypothetical protein H7039_05945 [Bryobacteraceae bacterium]|nr:hypothetical protein [Bryobacteraceae bacterium]
MPSNLLVVALLAGFCFVHQCHVFRFRAQLLDGYRLLLYCSVAGMVLLGLSRSLICAAKLYRFYWAIRPAWTEFADIPYLGTSIGSVVLALIIPACWNRFVDAEVCRRNEVEKRGDFLLALLQRAVREQRMLSLTLDNRKWYAGYVTEAPNLKPSEKYFKILPMLSGYRDKDSLEVRRTLSYDTVATMPGVDPTGFVITLPLADVKMANLFDPVVYKDHFASERPGPDAGLLP